MQVVKAAIKIFQNLVYQWPLLRMIIMIIAELGGRRSPIVRMVNSRMCRGTLPLNPNMIQQLYLHMVNGFS